MNSWKNPILLLSGIGISYLGNWIYLIALNIAILNLTGSATAVAGLYIIRPIAILITNTWSGSVIDRVNKRRLMIFIDIVRGILIMLIPFIGSLWFIYLLLLLVNIVGAFFGPSSTIYITKLVPSEKRKRFNSIMSMTNSGAFLIGPAISGILIMYFGTDLCIIINAITFLICALFIYLLPNVDKDIGEIREPIHLKTLIEDWKTVKKFIQNAKYFIVVYLLFQGAMLIGFALDSQEVTYIKQNLKLTDRDYGIIVSITGIGALAGAFVAAVLAKKIHLKLYIGVGMLLTSIGYVFFYSSFNFIAATFSFAFLGFFMAFANTGYATFFQSNVPIKIMGRFGSLADMIQGFIQIVFTLLLGFLAEWFSLQLICIVFSIVGTLFATILFVTILRPSTLLDKDSPPSRNVKVQ
ncbi:MFS transporter [Bacillus pseudomycoides]|uniref:MFS transporter n=1 Tax=Bacillus pseudomycoides TaxID=64104 RepID=A0AA91VGY6_9BACI|nr:MULTISPECIES: MFS transporter [Bacillus]PEB52242.1 MFS transporter [Bacillus sp. AFS098217]PED84080.1 MFS transporter [Bacillus pseudomycoides]PEU11660.1 MFS transporter [Bacillus sp. AFS019443]PEU12836.1 MFS transporter [Bacillus sp. AFS014408]PFW64731.1 MFS transporter [Bacillus sp. AFS075034]